MATTAWAGLMTRTLRLLFITSLVVAPFAGCAASGTVHTDPVGRVPPRESDWSRVARLRPGSSILVTLKGGRSVNRDFVAADEAELVALQLTDPTLPSQVRGALRRLMLNQPSDLFKVSRGERLVVGRVRLGPEGVFLDGQRVGALEQVVERTARGSIAEIVRVHRATARGFGLGALAGVGLGLAVTFGACGTDWSQESSSCGNLTPALVVIGPLFGSWIGAAAGASSQASTVVYRAP